MGAETQKLATVSFVTDTDVSHYEIGEVEASIIFICKQPYVFSISIINPTIF